MVHNIYLSCSISLNISTNRHQDKSQCAQNCHQNETLNSPPDIKDLRNRELRTTGNNTGQGLRRREQGMLLETGSDIRAQTACDLLL